VLITSDANIKNNVAISILHIYKRQEIITKSVYHIINVTEVELFTIRCGINCIIHLQNVEFIICYDLGLCIKEKDTLLYWVTQENLIEFLSTNAYLIY